MKLNYSLDNLLGDAISLTIPPENATVGRLVMEIERYNSLFKPENVFNRSYISWDGMKNAKIVADRVIRASLLRWCAEKGPVDSWPRTENIQGDIDMLAYLQKASDVERMIFLRKWCKLTLEASGFRDSMNDLALDGMTGALLGETSGYYMLLNGFNNQNLRLNADYKNTSTAFGLSQWLHTNLIEFVLYASLYCNQKFGTDDVSLGFLFTPFLHHSYEFARWKNTSYHTRRISMYIDACNQDESEMQLIYDYDYDTYKLSRLKKAQSDEYTSTPLGIAVGNYMSLIQGVYPRSSSFGADAKAKRLIRLMQQEV